MPIVIATDSLAQSCMTEAQKYEGALHKEKDKQKNQRKGKNESKQLAKSNASANHRQPYVEDGSDGDNLKANMAPPPAPSPPPPAAKSSTTPQQAAGKPINVFDYLVTEQTPNASKVSLGPKEQMQMVDHAPSVFEPSKALANFDAGGEDEENRAYDVAYEENGFSYGAGPIPPMYEGKVPNVSMEFMTPAPKKKKDRSRSAKKGSPENGPASGAVSDKKRKRGPTEDLDMADAADTPMMDAPSSVLNNPGTPMLNHSGLTGGLNRLMRSPSLEGDDQNDSTRRRYQDASSPIKRTRRNEKETNNDGLGISIKNRAGRLVSSMFGGSAVSGSSGSGNNEPSKAVVRRRSSSSDGQLVEIRRPKKTSRVRNATNGHVVSGESRKSKRKSSAHTENDRPSRRLKQIEYRRDSDRSRSRSPRRDNGSSGGGQMVVYREPNVPDELQREMATHFLSLVTKGPESSRGLSVNKTLKRFHRDFTDEYDDDRGRGHGRSRADRERRNEDEKDLWRTLRLKKNDRGEVVVFF